MAKCSYCNKFILGGKKQGSLRFCNDECHQNGFLAPLAARTAPEVVAERIREVHQQRCPVCGGSGPVDICTSHTAWSLIILTSWKDHPRLSCASCGKKSIWRGLALTSLFGWWGLPFGPIVTPLQLINGVRSLNKLPDASGPSETLQQMVKLDVASQLAATPDV
jgi:hypothetical protein